MSDEHCKKNRDFYNGFIIFLHILKVEDFFTAGLLLKIFYLLFICKIETRRKNMKNLVEYSSSEESDEEEEKRLEETTIKKLPMLLPVKETEKTSIKECPENHQMRSRSFEHVEGNLDITFIHGQSMDIN